MPRNCGSAALGSLPCGPLPDSSRASATFTIVGDVHRWWRAADAAHLERQRPDLALFVGDLGDEDLEIVQRILAVQVKKAVLLGNHDQGALFDPDGFNVGAERAIRWTRAELERRAAELTARFARGDVPRPPHWGGYRVSLARIEFWQGDKYRLHDRIAYTRNADGNYAVTRLCP